jgi:TP901 family phage tail tape measure protein
LPSTVRLIFLGDASSAVRSVSRLQGAFGGLGRAARLAVGALAIGVVGALAASTKAAIDFDKAMRNVNSIAQLSERQFQSLSNEVLALSKVTGQGPTTLAEGLYDIVSSGFQAEEGLKVLRASAIAATAGLTDTATATKAVVAVLNAYHLEAKDAATVSDVLFQTVNKGVLSFAELSSQIGDVLPAASALGVPLTEIGGALATVTLHGVNAAEAATQVKQLLVSMLKPSSDLGTTFEKLGFESGQVALKQRGLTGVIKLLSKEAGGNNALIADWFPNVRALAGFLGLAGKNVGVFTKNVEAMNPKGEAANATAKAFAEQGKSIAVQWQRAKASLTAAAIPIGQLLFPLLAKGAAKVEEFAGSIEANMPRIQQRFGQLSSVLRDLLPIIQALGRFLISNLGIALAGAALAMIGFGKAAVTAKNAYIALRTTLVATNPILAAITIAVGLLAFAALNAAMQTDAWKEATDGLTGSLKDLKGAADSLNDTELALAEARLANKGAILGIADAEDILAQARKSGDPKQIEHAELGLQQARVAARRAADNLTKAEQAHAKATNQTRKANEEAKKAIESSLGLLSTEAKKANQHMATLSGTTKLSSERQKELADKFRAAARGADKAADSLREQNPELAQTADDAADANRAVAGLILSLGRLPTKKEVRVALVVEGLGYLSALEEHLALIQSKTVTVTTRTEKGRAGGGPLSAGTPAWVGEMGRRELFVPNVSGRIMPQSAVGGGGIQIYLQLNAEETRRLMRGEVIARADEIGTRMAARADERLRSGR